MTTSNQPAAPKTCVINFNTNEPTKTTIEMAAAESAIIFSYHDLISKLVDSKTIGAWVVDAEHMDGKFNSMDGRYQHSASRYYCINEVLHSCTVELLGLKELSTDLSFIAVKLNKNGRSEALSTEFLEINELMTEGVEHIINKINRVIVNMLYAEYDAKIWDTNIKEIPFDAELIKNKFIKKYYPEMVVVYITDIDVISFKSYRGIHTAYVRYKFKGKNYMRGFNINEYLLAEKELVAIHSECSIAS